MSWKSIVKGVSSAVAGFIPGGGIINAAVQLALPEKKTSFTAPAGQTYNIGGTGVATSSFASQGIQQVSAQLPVLAMGQNQAIQQQGAGGLPVPWFKGPGGKLQMPWNDPRIPDYLKQFALDDAYLKTYVRAPKGYVILRDSSGRPFAVNKQVARSMGLWKPAAKPPISATDYKHFKRNKTIEKKLRKIAGPVLRKHTTRTVAVSSKRK
jgi:hypothetical protein